MWQCAAALRRWIIVVRCVCKRVHMSYAQFLVIGNKTHCWGQNHFQVDCMAQWLMILLLLSPIVPLLHDEQSYWIQKRTPNGIDVWINEWFFQHFSHFGYIHQYGRTFDAVVIFISVNAIRYYVQIELSLNFGCEQIYSRDYSVQLIFNDKGISTFNWSQFRVIKR